MKAIITLIAALAASPALADAPLPPPDGSVEEGMDLLQRSSKPVKQVAEAAGFQNEKSFIRAFKTWSGQTPAEFRRSATPGT